MFEFEVDAAYCTRRPKTVSARVTSGSLGSTGSASSARIGSGSPGSDSKIAQLWVPSSKRER